MNRIIEWFARNGVAANILMVSIVAAGAYSMMNKTVIQEYPDYKSRTITVSVTYRGSTPTEIEESIVLRLEENLFDVEGVTEMDARASSSSGSVSLTIDDNYDINRALDEVKNRVDTIRTFPIEAERPQITFRSFEERVITVVVAGDLSETDMKILGESVRDEIGALESVTLTSLKAVRPYEIAIEVPEATLKQYGLSFDTVVRAVRNHSVDLSAGSIKTEGGNILLRTSQQAYTQLEFDRIPVLTTEDGTRITLADIAHVQDGFDEMPIEARFNGKRAIAIDVVRTGDQSLMDIGGDVKDYIDRKSLTLPEGIELTYWQDDSARVGAMLNTLKGSAIMAFFLVMIILSLFLRPTLAFWVALGIPIAFSGAFYILPLIDVSVNRITLFAFILVLGIVVDDAIVTGENIYQHMRRGASPLEASIKGTQEIATPVIFGVLTTMVAFYPITTMTGGRGSFFKMIPFVVIPVLFFSLIESKLILPAHLKHCKNLGRKNEKKNWLTRFQRFFADGLEKFVIKYYKPVLEFCLKFRYATASAFVALLLVFIGVILGDRLPYSSFPRIPRDRVQVGLTMPSGTTFEVTQKHINNVEKHAIAYRKELNEKHGVEIITDIFATAGGRPFGGGFRGGPKAGVPEEGEVVIEMISAEESGVDIGSRDITLALRDLVGPIPEAEQFSFSFSRGASGALELQIVGPSIDDLKEVSLEVQKKMASYEGLYDIEDSFERATEELELELKPAASHLGVTAQQLASQVRQAFFGSEAQKIQRGRDDVNVMVRYPREERRSLASLRTMMIRTQNGTEVPFEEVAKVVPGKALPSIRRVDRNRIIRVSADGDSETVDVDAIQADIIDNFMPPLLAKYPGMSVSLEGRERDTRNNNAELIKGVYFVLAFIYVLLAIPFKSYVQPLIVMSAIPFGIIGALLGHMIMNYILLNILGRAASPAANVSMMSLLGMMALSGVVVNDSLVMVDFINQQLKKGLKIGEAVRLAGVRRFRAILLTSLTTFFGLAPLMFDAGSQTQWLIPMAISLGW
ncbi:MAG: efflux RND transporter permease subunit, partial [Opitutales bacterium]|nr:efflux RND transporter permease subunit [Opitutales bacterium]